MLSVKAADPRTPWNVQEFGEASGMPMAPPGGVMLEGAARNPLISSFFNHCRVDELLAQGCMGAVYLVCAATVLNIRRDGFGEPHAGADRGRLGMIVAIRLRSCPLSTRGTSALITSRVWQQTAYRGSRRTPTVSAYGDRRGDWDFCAESDTSSRARVIRVPDVQDRGDNRGEYYDGGDRQPPECLNTDTGRSAPRIA